MTYTVLNKELRVIDENGGLRYFNPKVIDVHQFEEGPVVSVDNIGITLVRDDFVYAIGNVLDYVWTSEFLIVVEKHGNTILGSLFDNTLTLKTNLYLVDKCFWIFTTSGLQLLLPWLALEVTGFRDNKLYGYKHNKKVSFNLETRIFNRESTLIDNITEAFKTRIIKE